MPRLSCPVNEWTTVPGTTDTLIEAKSRGVYIDTTGALTADQGPDGYTLNGNEAMIINGANVTSIRVMPANKVHPVDIIYQPA